MYRNIIIYIWLIIGTLAANAQENTLPGEEPIYTLFMIGDAGDDTIKSKPVLNMIKQELQSQDAQKCGIIFLGDNIYPEGLHKKSSELRAEDEHRINAQLNIVKNFEGKAIFIPGNHDWDRFGRDGLKSIKREGKYVAKYLDDKKAFLPKNGCPGPVVVKLSPGLVMIVIDTQWWLQKYDRSSGLEDGCDCRNEDELIVLLKDELKKYRNYNIIVAAHHPLYSNGEHGGHFKLKDHIFPLTQINSKAYVPLPVLGSIYPFYRKYIGHSQDIANPVYQDMVNKITKVLYEYDNIIYIAGHEHNLQYHKQKAIHQIISGAGSKTSNVIKNNECEFALAQRGYAKLLYYPNGDVWLQFFTISDSSLPTFQTLLYQRKIKLNLNTPSNGNESYKTQFETIIPNAQYAASNFKKIWLGQLNREVWTTPIRVPYLDINYDKGGLTPIKKGGGQQTLSLRMQGADGYQYILRGVKKSPAFLIERKLRGTITQDLVYDGMAGSHPYAAVTIPTLSKAANIFYSKPKLVYVPKDSVLGIYKEEFGGMLCLFEERPNKDMSAWDNFGNSKNVINYSDALENLEGKYSHVVDKDYMVRARLFDILIGDWDRHDDQWRWATFKEDGKTVYRAIPRDRDQAFFHYDGVLLSISNRKWLLRKFQPFKDDIRDMAGIGFNARYFDRAFLNEASKEDWLKQAQYIKEHITDDVIEKAIRELPPEGFEVNGEEIIATLKVRRDKLSAFAGEFYHILSKTVSVHATFKDDYIFVKRNTNGSVTLKLYPRKNGKPIKEKMYYSRTFYPEETKEIRVYGLEGKDEYKITGEVQKSILIRIIAGDDKDKVEDKSKVSGLKKHTLVYDDKGKNTFEKSSETKVTQLKSTKAYDYDRKDFKFDKAMPLISTGYNKDDGFFIGPGFSYTHQGFKKEPYKYYHRILANRAFSLNGYNIYYDFDYRKLIGPFDVTGFVHINLPDIFMNFDHVTDPDIDYDDKKYSALMNNYNYNLSLKLTSDNEAHFVKFGVNYQHVDFDKIPDNIIPGWETESQSYIAPAISYQFQNADNLTNPHRGFKFNTSLEWKTSLENDRISYANLNSQLCLYEPLYIVKQQTTLALRTGFKGNFGDYTFYQSNYINPTENFRGVQRNRFTAKSFLFQNVEMRQSLFKVHNYLSPFDVGILAHADFIKLWKPVIIEEKWYSSYGFGAFTNVLDSFILNGTYSVSDQNKLFTLSTSFLF